MPSSEGSILNKFLLTPAPLRNFMTLHQFTNIFPPKLRSNPVIRELYLELQHQRAADIDDVRRNIATEVKRGERQKREVVKIRQSSHNNDVAGLDMVGLKMEGELFGYGRRNRATHTRGTVHLSIEQACDSVEAQIAEMEAEIKEVLSEVSEAVGELSDLRYGRFTKSTGAEDDIVDEVLSTLRRLEAACANPAG
ncbi:hypothetical protein K469DRAFT_559231 [Zopfia rhizophila CBS 207.26]|uniref:Cnl2/NKP2 family protein-domain-containing protein n=1 Tax=Zopfia rhizophila CBS 207.26 TaxID=1314779 RepID=A0A6A6EEU3_9PEZI|nr:hypothetical protein K469DRAFT_559231 [Zopfia rhizophila CBS 207.26]